MNSAAVEQIARAVLYEGYLLYPYRASSVKNHQRWTFGGLYPPAYVQAMGGSEPGELLTECLVQGDLAVLEVQVRFLHLLERSEVEADSDRVLSRQEAVEREAVTPALSLQELLARPHRQPFTFPASHERDPAPARIERRQEALAGLVEVSAVRLDVPPGQELFKVSVRVGNITPMPGMGSISRDEALLRSLVSTHVVLGVQQGAFMSLMDPGEAWREAAADCRNVGVWPVLVGAEGDSDTMLASPIILYDYPLVAPESPGDLFDGTEIDEILSLRILTLSESEKAEVNSGDERGRALLARTEALAREQLLGLHGTFRGLRPVESSPGVETETFGWPEDRPRLECVPVGAVEVRPGSRVRLRPGGTADIFDRALEGKTATVQSIEQDYEDRIFLGVTVDDDPGKDLGVEGKPGHRFFFRPDEVEPLDEREEP